MSITKVSVDQLKRVIVRDIMSDTYRVRGTGPGIVLPGEQVHDTPNGQAMLDAIATMVCIGARANRKKQRVRRKARRGWA